EIAQKRERGSEGRLELGRPQIEQRVPRSTREGPGDTGAGRRGEAVGCLVIAEWCVRQQRARRQDGHAHRLHSKRRWPSAQPPCIILARSGEWWDAKKEWRDDEDEEIAVVEGGGTCGRCARGRLDREARRPATGRRSGAHRW